MAADARIRREEQTLRAMIRLYCRGQRHGTGELCESCSALCDYAVARLASCPYGASKPTCDRCPVHCYRRAEREQVRAVMRYAGPRMLRAHPVLAIWHLLDRRRRRTRPEP